MKRRQGDRGCDPKTSKEDVLIIFSWGCGWREKEREREGSRGSDFKLTSTSFPPPFLPLSSTMPVIETIKKALHLDHHSSTTSSTAAAPSSSTAPSSSSAPVAATDLAVPATATTHETPAFDSKDVTVLFVLGGPGVGEYMRFFVVERAREKEGGKEESDASSS